MKLKPLLVLVPACGCFFDPDRPAPTRDDSAGECEAEAEAEGEAENVALAGNGGVATGSSSGSYAGYDAVAENANDGDAESFWAPTSVPAWLQVQFDRQYSISRVLVRNQYHSIHYDVLLSTDGDTWTALVSDHATPDLQPSGDAEEDENASFDITPMDAGYINVSITQTDAPFSHIYKASLSEVEAWGTP